MKTIAIHSHKGGVGKTTVALLVAKHAVLTGRTVCVVDLDFIGSGIADLFALETLPNEYVESYFVAADPHGFDLARLLGTYTDADMRSRSFSLLLNVGRGLPKKTDESAICRLQNHMMGLVADEERYREIENKLKLLLERLGRQHGAEVIIIDCHPGLGLVSDTARGLADLSVYVTTPNRSDCFGLLKTVNLKRLDNARSMLIVNRAPATVVDAASFQSLMESDAVVGTDSEALFPQLHHLCKKETHFAVIPESERLRAAFYLGGAAHLPRISAGKTDFQFLDKVLSLI
jgi:cellulose biosynthesis protein BcsQ